MERAGIAMRLKDRKDLVEISRFCCAKGCADLRRVMSVIVDDRYAVTRLHLESPVDAAETFEAARDERRLDSHIACRCECGRGVPHVVPAGHVQFDFLPAAAVELKREAST